MLIIWLSVRNKIYTKNAQNHHISEQFQIKQHPFSIGCISLVRLAAGHTKAASW